MQIRIVHRSPRPITQTTFFLRFNFAAEFCAIIIIIIVI